MHPDHPPARRHSPHVVPVGVTYDPEAGLARVITRGGSAKAAHVRAAGPAGARVAVCQVERGTWATLEGIATVCDDPERVADAVRRYAERYGRTPTPNPERVVIEIALTRAMGNAGTSGPGRAGSEGSGTPATASEPGVAAADAARQ